MGTAKVRGLRRLYANRVTNAMGHGFAVPFFEYYAVRIGASPLQVSGLQSVSQLVPNVLQVGWGWWTDRLGRRLPFVVAGTLVVALSFALLAAIPVEVTGLIVLVALFAVGISIAAPAWSALIGERTPQNHRGETLGVLAQATQIASIAGIGITGAFFALTGGFESSSFRVCFAVGAVLVLASVFLLTGLGERRGPAVERFGGDLRSFLRGNEAYRYLLAVQCFFVFVQALAWGLIPVTVTRDLRATNMDIALLALFGALPVLAVQRAVGRASDRIGALPLLQVTRFLYVPVPLVYAVTTSLWPIYAVELLLALAAAAGNVAFTAYLLDLSPPEMRGKVLGLYNGLVGISAFGGVLLGGYLVEALAVSLGTSGAFFFVYALSTAGRGVGSFFYLRLRPLPASLSLRERMGEVFTIYRHWKRQRMG